MDQTPNLERQCLQGTLILSFVDRAEMAESQDRYIRRHNVGNFRRQLLAERDETKRQMILKLLAEELQKQLDGGDPVSV